MPTEEAISMWSDSSDAQDGEVRVTVGVDTHADQHVGVALVPVVAGVRPVRAGTTLSTPLAAAKLALKGLAIRYRQLSAEIDALDDHLGQLVATAAPALLAVKGVGTDIAGALLVAAGDNPERLHSEAAFASLCGVAPIPASSGKTNRHRLSRGGDRDVDHTAPLGPGSIVVTDLRVAQELREHEPGV